MLDLNKMSDKELEGMVLLYGMQVQQNMLDSVTGKLDADAVKEDASTYGQLRQEQDERNRR